MDYTVLFFQTTSLHHHCNSDVYSSASGMADLQQLTTLQYCLIDNCTIIRIDTGQQLDIVYTTQSHLVVTPTDGQTSMLISKNDPELFCSTPIASVNTAIIQVVIIIVSTLIILASGSIILVHMMFKQLHNDNIFGKLMILYNIAKITQYLSAVAIIISHHSIALHSLSPCYLFYFLFMESTVIGETFSTTMLAYLAYIMYYSYRGREVTKEINKKPYKYAIRYVLGASILFCIFVVGYDFGTGTYKHTLLPNGHCVNFIDYNTLRLMDSYAYINEIVKVFLLVTYFVYYYKFNKLFTIIRSMPKTDTQQNRLFLKIAIIMGVNLGISQMAYPFWWIFNNELFLYMAAIFFSFNNLQSSCSWCVPRMCHNFAKRDSVLERRLHNVTIMSEQCRYVFVKYCHCVMM